MFGKRKRNLFKLNLRDKFSPIKYDKIKFHEVSVCFVRKQNRDEWKISPRNFTFIRLVLEIILFPEFSLFFLAFPRVERRDISFNNWNFFRGSKMDRFLFLESVGSNGNGEIRSRTARFNWISNIARLELDLYFAFRAREWSRGSQSVADFMLAPRRTAVDLVSRSGNREKGGFLLPLPRSKIKFPFPTFYLLEGASLSPTSTSKLHFPRVWSSRNASREIDSLNSIDEPSWRSGVRVLTSFIRLPSSLKACLRSREIKINELVEFNPNFSRNRRTECYLRSRKCLHSARKKKERNH